MNLKVSLHEVDKLREQRRILQNSLVSSFLKYAVTIFQIKRVYQYQANSNNICPLTTLSFSLT
ncbi:MAG: palindromic element RPE3 domain-containing protein [Rickettsia endosymbiont of Ixodes persulcatus]|nr:palindromic element RPE3 domain-containing protein [Rickettsia endosymbiont of Ixodes persulcatus]MCZ6902461.1 palindromic element RPE3 domain-containing protein [Rickettsia endosymbiont of Ixodes persulcatus]MCZ6902976.1 palindromic element RPE3 domain-containing protein [Rickettsia endosymbiont of Ixodes persulcatus]MCZ6908816.1 palindromic element RPE3 domain-containing protein [Rickettsia endosymbiont of Ixodes persulcatus]MCZ6910893.1 palindromic element RPE3 domain-containing protein [